MWTALVAFKQKKKTAWKNKLEEMRNKTLLHKISIVQNMHSLVQLILHVQGQSGELALKQIFI